MILEIIFIIGIIVISNNKRRECKKNYEVVGLVYGILWMFLWYVFVFIFIINICMLVIF